ncbi:MAG: hypothetical protein LBC40_04875, partial [Dysgonamonadaceae bacterium]|nr:hypothetical protein [Dysgonamonadaceae bacterium]
MIKRLVWIIIPILATACSQGITVNGVSISEDSYVISLQNKQVKVGFDLQTGYYQIIDRQSGIICVDSACAQKNDWKTTDRLIRTWKAIPDTSGQSLLIESADAGNRTL